MSIKVYVEGGGDKNPSLNRQCRAGFREFFEKAGLKGSMPKVIPCGSREKTYDRFSTAINDTQDDSFIVLLRDLEPKLKQATKSCSKGKGTYQKGRHSFELLGCLEPNKVMESSPHTRRLIDTLRQS